jgi:hypothetical protein
MNAIGKKQYHNINPEKPCPKPSNIHNTENIFFLMEVPVANLYSLVHLPHHNFIMNSGS